MMLWLCVRLSGVGEGKEWEEKKNVQKGL